MGRKDTVITRSEKKQRGPYFLGRLQDQGGPGRVRRRVLDVLEGVFDHDHRRVHHHSDGQCDAPRLMMLALMPLRT